VTPSRQTNILHSTQNISKTQADEIQIKSLNVSYRTYLNNSSSQNMNVDSVLNSTEICTVHSPTQAHFYFKKTH